MEKKKYKVFVLYQFCQRKVVKHLSRSTEIQPLGFQKLHMLTRCHFRAHSRILQNQQHVTVLFTVHYACTSLVLFEDNYFKEAYAVSFDHLDKCQIIYQIF